MRSNLPQVLLLIITAAVSGPSTLAALPEPPNQRLPWRAPSSTSGTGLPDSYLEAARVLFDAGLADPRGGVYRAVRFSEYNRIPAVEFPPLRGWVFQAQEGSPHRTLVVDWNGLVHLNAVILEDPADLDTDIQGLITLLESEADRYKRRFTKFPALAQRSPLLSGDLASSEHPMIDQVSHPEQVILMLLRWNQPELASKVWAAAKDLPSAPSQSSTRSLANRWLVASYLRLVNEFQSGSDEEALEIAESLTSWHARVRDWLPAEDTKFLTPLPLLLADSKRRVFLGKTNPSNIDDTSSSLIRQLEEVRAGKFMYPGSLQYATEPLYARLRKAGDRVVDGLIDAWEHDTRLTRTFEYSRPWSREQTPIPVREVARILLSDILGDPVRVNHSTPAELRAWWHQSSRSIPTSALVERNFAMLADDHATPEQWSRAASFLTTRLDLEPQLNGNSAPASACQAGKPAPPVRGESLRDRANPSLIELLSRRATTLVAREPEAAAEQGCIIAYRAALWDPVAALPLLRAVSANSNSCRGDYRVAIARLSQGDNAASSEWLTARNTSLAPPAFGTHVDAWAMPFWMFPHNSLFEQSLAEDLRHRRPNLREFAITPVLLVSPGYRRTVLASLEDGVEIGTYTVEADRAVNYSLHTGGGGGSSPVDEAEPAGPLPLRAKDYVAYQLSMTDGFPEFRLHWPAALKDMAISGIARFIAGHADDFRAFPSRLDELDCPNSSRLIFKTTP